MFKTRKALAAALTAVLTATLMTVAPQSANASTSREEIVWSQPVGPYCVKALAGISHFEPGGLDGNLAFAEAWSQGWAALGGCTLPRTGWARVRLEVQVWDWNNNIWTHCRNSGPWTYGPTGWLNNDSGGRPYGPSVAMDYQGSASCGSNYYRTLAWGEYGGATGENWVGGSVASPEEWVP